MKNKQHAFTIVELLTVIAIISLLLSLAIPALNESRKRAREVGDRASMSVIGNALENFSNDMGFYPDSTRRTALRIMDPATGLPFPPVPARLDQGAHILFEALAGLDQLGYQMDHRYEVGQFSGVPCVRINNRQVETRRWGPYIKLESIIVSTMLGSYPDNNYSGVLNDNPFFADSIDPEQPLPILYYRAHSERHLLATDSYPDSIYNYDDNIAITMAMDQDNNYYSPEFTNLDPTLFFRYIHDPRTGGVNGFLDVSARPYNSRSFILISAGRDGRYGTIDDITNWLRQ